MVTKRIKVYEIEQVLDGLATAVVDAGDSFELVTASAQLAEAASAEARAKATGHKVEWGGVYARAKLRDNRMRGKISDRLKNAFGSRFTKRVTRATAYWFIDGIPVNRRIIGRESRIQVFPDGNFCLNIPSHTDES